MLLPQEAAVSFRRTQRNVRSGNAKPRSKKAAAAQRRTPRASSHSSVRASIVSGSEWPQWQWHLGDGFDTAGRSAGHGASPWSSFRFAFGDSRTPRVVSPAGPSPPAQRPDRSTARSRPGLYKYSTRASRSANPKVACAALIIREWRNGLWRTACSPGVLDVTTPDPVLSDTLRFHGVTVPHGQQIDTRSDAWVPDSRLPGLESIRRHIRRRKLAELALSCRCGCLPPTTRSADPRRAE